MTLTAARLERAANRYRQEGPLYPVEAEAIETLPSALARGAVGWRDVEWIVQWYYRRSLGAMADSDRATREARFGENEFEAVLTAIESASDAANAPDALEALTELEGVDVSVGSAFLMFIDPERYIVMSDHEWAALGEVGELEGPFPTAPSSDKYERYLETCRSVADRLECELWTLYQALWWLSSDQESVPVASSDTVTDEHRDEPPNGAR